LGGFDLCGLAEVGGEAEAPATSLGGKTALLGVGEADGRDGHVIRVYGARRGVKPTSAPLKLFAPEGVLGADEKAVACNNDCLVGMHAINDRAAHVLARAYVVF